MKNTQVICLWGGPGCGKSTTAAGLFYEMKLAGMSVELVREYVKDWAWEGRKINPEDQIYILGKQYRKESILYGKVDYVITDSSFYLGGVYSLFYGGDSRPKEWAQSLMATSPATYRHFVLSRLKPYDTAGRNETEATAREIDTAVCDYLGEGNYELIETPDRQRVDHILGKIK